jgi:hypothetical protein
LRQRYCAEIERASLRAAGVCDRRSFVDQTRLTRPAV